MSLWMTKMVRSRRLELPRGFPHSDLNAARLPFRHDRARCETLAKPERLLQAEPGYVREFRSAGGASLLGGMKAQAWFLSCPRALKPVLACAACVR